MKTVIIIVLLAWTTGCTVQSDKLSLGDLLHYYVAPSVCEKMKECQPVEFSAQYPQGVEQCADVVGSKITGDRSELTGCTDAEAKQCRDDMQGLACPADKAPPSCDVCTYDK